MKKLVIGLLLLLPVFLIYEISCIPASLNQFYTLEDVIFEPGLLGTWVDEDPADLLSTWEFSASGEDHYLLLHTDGEGMARDFQVHMFALGDDKFLDIAPIPDEYSDVDTSGLPEQNAMLQLHTITGHSLWRVDQVGPTIELAIIDYDAFGAYLEECPDAVSYEVWGYDEERDESQGTVLTAATEELQAFILEFSKLEDSFSVAFSLIPEAESVHLGAPAEQAPEETSQEADGA
jgi:hypothetical protein